MDIKAAATSVSMKLIAIAVFVGVVAGASWYVRGLIADADIKDAKEETREAVSDEYETKLAESRANEREARAVADAQHATLVAELESIQKGMRGVRAELAADRAANEAFYKQSLPPAGYAAWVRTRQVVQQALGAKGGQK